MKSGLRVLLISTVASTVFGVAAQEEDAWQKHNQAGMAAYSASKYGEAEKHWKAALKEAEKSGEASDRLIASLRNLGTLDATRGRSDSAERYYKRALAACEKLRGPHDLIASDILAQLSDAYRNWMRPATMGRRTTERYTTLWSGSTDTIPYGVALPPPRTTFAGPTPLTTMPIPGTDIPAPQASAARAGRYREAAEALERALAIRGKAWDADSPKLLPTLDALGLLFQLLNQPDKAEVVYQRMSAIREKEPADGVVLVASLLQVAQVQVEQKKYAAAEGNYQRALSIAAQSAGPESPAVATTLLLYADLLRKMHRGAEAAPLEARAKSIREKLEKK